jgi:hypothetical protein
MEKGMSGTTPQKTNNRSTIRANSSDEVLVIDDRSEKVDRFVLDSFQVVDTLAKAQKIRDSIPETRDRGVEVIHAVFEWMEQRTDRISGVLVGPAQNSLAFGIMFITKGEWHDFELDDEIADLEIMIRGLSHNELGISITSRPERLKNDHLWFFTEAQYIDAESLATQGNR